MTNSLSHEVVWLLLFWFQTFNLFSFSISCLLFYIITKKIIVIKVPWILNYFRGRTELIVNLLPDENLPFLSKGSVSCNLLSVKKPGFLGWCSFVSLLNIETTWDITGLSVGSSWTHSSPIWITRNTSTWLLDSKMTSSVSPKSLSSL